jgi:hypothetical protein
MAANREPECGKRGKKTMKWGVLQGISCRPKVKIQPNRSCSAALSTAANVPETSKFSDKV